MNNGIIDILHDVEDSPSIAQRIMQFKPFTRVYESRFYRRSIAFSIVMGIPFKKEYIAVLKAADLRGNEKLLDIACGPGIYSRRFSRMLQHGSVVGLDLSRNMLDYANYKAKKEGSENLSLVHGNALELPFPDNEFDAVNCGGALYLLPDVPRAMQEINRVLKPRGRFTTSVLRNCFAGKGRLIDKFGRLYTGVFDKAIGLHFFRPGELILIFRKAGLVNVKCLHSKRFWMIMSAVKPESRSQETGG